ncbi:ATP-binding protein [Actinoplanes sp. NBRC 103695]|uniref:ATP-binding protein n=1 Tax=Actinoplanes sp. NBRC 103695 TaxID=3032202 RepID=UPI0024A023E3|nr:ATP-binding protein [Actinoplanes sp. NBRC 103695]GLY92956.1 hypothetical protein Acsp02_02120 [Actinoplanes sp. NBRC 103695]
MPDDQRRRRLRKVTSVVSGVCMLVLLPLASNIATGLPLPGFLQRPWVIWTAVALLGAIAVLAYDPQAPAVPEVVPPKDYGVLDEPSAEGQTAGAEPDEDDEDGFAPLYSAPVRVEGLPERVRGRKSLLATLAEYRRQGGLVVLAGAGGTGKSTLARELVRSAAVHGQQDDPAWEVSAVTAGGLVDGLRAVAAGLTSDQATVAEIGAATPESPDQLWRLLDDAPAGWLLIVDNADELEMLGRPGRDGGREAEPVRDGTGWLRVARTGLVLVTSRHRSRDRWPAKASVIDVGQLEDDAAAAILLDLAPRAGPKSEARDLARRLGKLPLALRLAGLYLNSPYAPHNTFRGYHAALDADPRFVRAAETAADNPAAVERMMLMRTWELSLDALAARGMPQARPALRLLSCFAAGESIPLALLGNRLDSFLAACVRGAAPPSLRQLLEGLDNLGLITLAEPGSRRRGITGPGIRVHAVVADTNRQHLLETRAKAHERLIRITAVTLIATELDGLSPDRLSAWAKYRLLTPHLQALLTHSAPRLDDAALITLATTSEHAAQAYGYMDRAQAGITLLRSLLDARSAWNEPVAETRLEAWQQLARLLGSSTHPAEAERIWLEVLKVRSGSWPADSAVVLAARHNVLDARRRQLSWEQVRPDYEELLAQQRRVLGADFRLTLMTRQLTAIEVGWQGDWPAAERLLRTVAADATRTYGENGFITLIARSNHIESLRRSRPGAEADNEARRLRGHLEETLGKDHVFTKGRVAAGGFLSQYLPSSPWLHEDFAGFLFEKGMAMAAENEIEPALQAFDELIARFGTATSPRIAEIVALGMFNKGNLLFTSGRSRKAAAVYDDLIARYDGQDSTIVRSILADALHNRAVAARWDPDQRIDAAQQALSRLQQLAEEAPEQFAEAAAKAAVFLRELNASAPGDALAYASETGRKKGGRREALGIFDHLIARYQKDSAPAMQELVADALLQRAILLSRPDDETPGESRTGPAPGR